MDTNQKRRVTLDNIGFLLLLKDAYDNVDTEY